MQSLAVSISSQSYSPYGELLAVPRAASEVAAQKSASQVAGGAESQGGTEATDRPVPSAVQELSPEDKRVQQQLQSRDREVRAHEAAHLAAGAGLIRSGMSFTYQLGPDARRYAVGGEVSIDTSPVANDPEATLLKAQQIQAAALAPANPSAQDRAVASSAAQMALEAQVELAAQRREALSALQGSGGSHSAISAYRSAGSAEQGSVLDQIA
jgi:hypothetical protein